jgi:hypothetical protein
MSGPHDGDVAGRSWGGQCYDFLNIFGEKIGQKLAIFDSNYSCLGRKKYRNNGYANFYANVMISKIFSPKESEEKFRYFDSNYNCLGRNKMIVTLATPIFSERKGENLII